MRRFNVEPVDDATSWTLPATRQDTNDQLTTAAKKPVSATAESSSVQKDIKRESNAKKSGSQSPSRRRPDKDDHKQRAQGDEKETPQARLEALKLKLKAVKQSPKVKTQMLRTELKNMAKSVDDTTMRRILEQIMCMWKPKTPHGAKDLAKQHGSEINALAHLMENQERIKLADVRKMIETESKHQPKKITKKKGLKKKTQEAASAHAEEPKRTHGKKMKSKATDKKTTLEKPVAASKKPDRDHETQPEQRQKVQTKKRGPLTNPQDVLRGKELGIKSIGHKRRNVSSEGLSGAEFEAGDWELKDNETHDMRHKTESMMKQVAASAGRRQSTCEADKYWGGPTDGHDQDTNYLADKRRGIPPRDNEIPRQMLRNPQLCFQPPLKMNLSRQWQVQIKRTLTTEGQRQGHFNDARQGKHRLDNRQGRNDKKSADPATEEYRHGGKWHSATSK